MFVQVEDLLSVDVDAQKDERYERDEQHGAPGIAEGPPFEIGKIRTENHEAEKISHENQGGMALERRVRASERNFSEA